VHGPGHTPIGQAGPFEYVRYLYSLTAMNDVGGKRETAVQDKAL